MGSRGSRGAELGSAFAAGAGPWAGVFARSVAIAVVEVTLLAKRSPWHRYAHKSPFALISPRACQVGVTRIVDYHRGRPESLSLTEARVEPHCETYLPGKGPAMKPFWQIVNLGLRLSASFVIPSSAITVLAWGGESSPSTGETVAPPALPRNFLDSNLLNYGNLTTDYSGSDHKLSPRSPMPSKQKGVAFDFKTDYDVDVQKFLPPEGFPLYGADANVNSQNGGTQRKKPFFLGLSVSKPLN